jgi:hypothetical protein
MANKTANTKVTTNKATEKKAAPKATAPKKEAPKTSKPATPKKSEEKKEPKPAFDAKAIAKAIIEEFKADKSVDIVADTSLKAGPRDANQPEFSYIHFFRKGTEKDMFKMYNNSRGTRFAISRAVYESGKLKDAKPIKKKNKKGETVVVYANICVPTADAAATAKSIIEAYMAI